MNSQVREGCESEQSIQLGEQVLFNPELKERFLDNYKGTTKADFRRIFYRTAIFETDNNKDLYQFNYPEIKDMIKGFSGTTPKTLDHTKAVIAQYLKWANLENKMGQYIDITQFMVRQDIHESVSNYALNEQYIWSREIFYSIIDFCENYQDAVAIVLPYEGVRGKELEEIRNLKVTDVHPTKELLKDSDFIGLRSKLTVGNNTLDLTRDNGTKRTIEISAKSMLVILRAIIETEYFKNNGEVDGDVTAPVYEIIPTPYVVRYTGKTRKNAKDVRMNTQSITKRITKIVSLYQKPELNATTIFYSGLMNYLKQIELKDGTLTNNDYKQAHIRYGLKPERFWDTKDLYDFLKDKLK